MKEMNEDWVECTLGDLLKLKNGFAFKSSMYSPEGIPVLRIGDIQDWNVNLENANRIKEDKDYDFHIVNKGDILIAMSGATTGKFGIYNSDEKAYQNQRVGNLIPHSSKFTIKKYIYFLLYSLKYEIEKGAYGGAQPNISATKIEALNTILFPLPIQKAIVRKIEELFSSLDSGIADLKKAQEQLVIYRQAVLKKAFEGKFVIKKMGEIAEVKRGKSKHRPRNDKSLFGGKYPFIQTGEIRAANGGIINKFTNTYSEKGLNQSKLWTKGTLCLTVAANIGETAFLGFDACFPDSVVGINPQIDIINSKYLNFYIQKIKEEIDSKASATAQKNINVRILDAIEIPIPTLQQQHHIVQEIESRLSVCDKVEESIAESLEKAKALRQSILKKAFEGKLLSGAEIAKCKQDKDYEPAGVLLERIKKEKKNI